MLILNLFREFALLRNGLTELVIQLIQRANRQPHVSEFFYLGPSLLFFDLQTALKVVEIR